MGNQDMVDIMDRHMSMKTVSMVLMDTMDMVRGLLSPDIMAMHLVMTTGFRDSMAITAMVAMDMARDPLSLDMVDTMAMHMSMKTVSMVLMVTMVDMVMVKDQVSLGMDMAIIPAMTIGSRVSMAIMVTMGTKLI